MPERDQVKRDFLPALLELITSFIVNQEKLFFAIVETRKAMYRLMDMNLLRDDDIDAFEESILHRAGIDFDDYLEWKES